MRRACRKGALTCLVLLALPMGAALAQQTVTVPPIADNRIVTYSIDGNEGAADILSVYNNGGNIQRPVLQFDLSSIPVGSTIVSADFSLWSPSPLFSGSNNGQPTYLFRLTKPWTELGSTWLHADSENLWTFPGGDFVGRTGFYDVDPYATNTDVITGNLQQLHWDVTALVQEWVTGTPNFGLLLRSPEGNAAAFRSREDINPELIPRLSVTYAASPPPGSCLASIAELVAAVEADLRQGFGNPSFVIPGGTSMEQLQAIVEAIINLNHGRKLEVYTDLSGN